MIKQWWNNRKARQSAEKYSDGFGWAMTEYYLNGATVEDLESTIDIGLCFSGRNAFDDGAMHAVHELQLCDQIARRRNVLELEVAELRTRQAPPVPWADLIKPYLDIMTGVKIPPGIPLGTLVHVGTVVSGFSGDPDTRGNKSIMTTDSELNKCPLNTKLYALLENGNETAISDK